MTDLGLWLWMNRTGEGGEQNKKVPVVALDMAATGTS